jgi:hypothetical protein
MTEIGSLTAVRWVQGSSRATNRPGWVPALPYLLMLGLACLASIVLAIADPLAVADIFTRM